MNLSDFGTLSTIIQAIITSASLLIAGWWAYRRFVLQQEQYPNLNFSAEIKTIGRYNNETIVELVAVIENKGKAQHKMDDITFDLNALFTGDALHNDPQWQGQVNFPHNLQIGSFKPPSRQFYFVDPNTTAKFSFVTKLPFETEYAMLHIRFDYSNRRHYHHAAECTIKVA